MGTTLENPLYVTMENYQQTINSYFMVFIQNTLQLGACVRSGFPSKLQWQAAMVCLDKNGRFFGFFRFSCRSFEEINRPVLEHAIAYSAGHSPEKAISSMSCTSKLIMQNPWRPGGFPIWEPQLPAAHSAPLCLPFRTQWCPCILGRIDQLTRQMGSHPGSTITLGIWEQLSNQPPGNSTFLAGSSMEFWPVLSLCGYFAYLEIPPAILIRWNNLRGPWLNLNGEPSRLVIVMAITTPLKLCVDFLMNDICLKDCPIINIHRLTINPGLVVKKHV